MQNIVGQIMAQKTLQLTGRNPVNDVTRLPQPLTCYLMATKHSSTFPTVQNTNIQQTWTDQIHVKHHRRDILARLTLINGRKA